MNTFCKRRNRKTTCYSSTFNELNLQKIYVVLRYYDYRKHSNINPCDVNKILSVFIDILLTSALVTLLNSPNYLSFLNYVFRCLTLSVRLCRLNYALQPMTYCAPRCFLGHPLVSTNVYTNTQTLPRTKRRRNTQTRRVLNWRYLRHRKIFSGIGALIEAIKH